jgi:hypothetical protein
MKTIVMVSAAIIAFYVGWILILCRRALSKYLQAKTGARP